MTTYYAGFGRNDSNNIYFNNQASNWIQFPQLTTSNPRRVDVIQKSSQAYLPRLDTAKAIEIWRGLRSRISNGLPIISRSSTFENLIVAARHTCLVCHWGRSYRNWSHRW